MPRPVHAKAPGLRGKQKLIKRDRNLGDIRKVIRNRWYPFNIMTVRRNTARLCRLRKGLTPGTVVILLTGQYRGKRVVFLKQLERSGLLAVTGPMAINGVPLRRVGQRFVIVTSTKIDISNVDTDKINDAFFNKIKLARNWRKCPANYVEKQKKKKLLSRKDMQQYVDEPLLTALTEADPMMKCYLGSYFTIVPGQPPHAIKF